MSGLRHEIPTHLNVEDKAMLGLTVRQFMELMAGLAGTYGLWNQWPQLPLAIRAVLTGLSLLMTLGCTLVRPGGRGMEEWLFVVLEYVCVPKLTVWRPREPELAEWWPAQPRWEELSPQLAWGAAHGDSAHGGPPGGDYRSSLGGAPGRRAQHP